MRFLLAAILISALGAPVASALPAAISGPAASKADSTILVAKRGQKSAQRNSRANNYGIRPLVGSGDY